MSIRGLRRSRAGTRLTGGIGGLILAAIFVPARFFFFAMNPVIFKTAALLVLSNCFMTYAWYGHLKGLKSAPLIVAVIASWGVAFFEYLIMVPANRIGYAGGLELGQLKIMQEVITLCVFVPFAFLFMGEKWRWDYLWAFFCLVGAVYFVFRGEN